MACCATLQAAGSALHLLEISNAVVVVFSLKVDFAQPSACLLLRGELARHLRQLIEYLQEGGGLAQFARSLVRGGEGRARLPLPNLVVDVLAQLQVLVVMV
jgi:hypothetical protein